MIARNLNPLLCDLAQTYEKMIQTKIISLAVPAPKDSDPDECDHSDFTENGICGDCGVEVDRG